MSIPLYHPQLDASPATVARFWAKVDRSGPHWIFQGHKVRGGARFWVPGRGVQSARRIAFALQYGPIPEGFYLAMTCQETMCVWYEHMRLTLTPPSTHASRRTRQRFVGLHFGRREHP